ncbi:hypothetical protein ARC02_02500 [Stenotrophomonas africana]|nr:hypothetical protein ARC02_02500 [Stenotrophomonas maltophilia]
MSQQTNAGFKAPGFSVVADEPVGASPSVVAAISDSAVPPCAYGFVRIPVSSATGVFQRCNKCARIDTNPAELPASLFPFFAGASDVGVAHSAAAVTAARSGP